MESSVLNQFSDQLQRERRALVRELSQHQVLLNILTDIAGIRDTSTISRLNPSHGSADCSKEEDAGESSSRHGTQPGALRRYGDINLTTEERVDYEPPDAPPPQAAARFLAGDNIPKGVEG